MKKIIYYILFSGLFLTGCENDAKLYQGEENGVSGIYFLSKSGVQRVDSMEYSFQNDLLNVKEKELHIPVAVFGNVTDYPRTFKVKTIGGSAVLSEDFQALESEYIVAAGQAEVLLPFVLLRTDKLLKEKVDVTLQLEENEYFKLLIPVQEDGVSGKKLDATKFRIVFSELINQPAKWKSTWAVNYFGVWSVNKFKLINDIMGWTTADWAKASAPVLPGKYPYAATMLRIYLQQKADMKEPEYEDDGVTYMQLASAYSVNYSELEATDIR